MSENFYLTTPLYYVNGVPHVGHTYTTVIADAIARYKKICGLEVYALTGTDEHGLKIERSAKAQAITAQELTDIYAEAFKNAWQELGLRFDEFIRTTEDGHKRAVKKIFNRIYDNNFVYMGEYAGNYCVNCEAYVPEGEKMCSDCGRSTEYMTEQSYFFKLSDFQEKLLRFYEENPRFVIPETRMNEVVSFVQGGLKDLSISRTSFRWGIRVPENDEHIFYVWFDALTGYLSGVGFGTQEKKFQLYWPADLQLIGKDILRFHAVYWPAFLMAAGLEPPHQILVNGWWTVDGEKMSKSRGNTVTTQELSQLARPDYIKYFLLREISIGADGNFSYDLLLSRVNTDLANDLGNLCSRILKMVKNYFDGCMPDCREIEGGDVELRRFTAESIKLYRDRFDRFEINKAIDKVWELISRVNKYLVINEPWVLARDPSQRGRLGTVLYNSGECLRIIAILMAPVIPDGASKILKQLGVKTALDDQRISHLSWGGLEQGSLIGEIEPIYPRLDSADFMKCVDEKKQRRGVKRTKKKEGTEALEPEEIKIGDFAKVEIRVGKVITAEHIKKSEKLVRLEVDIGSETRQVVAGIGDSYSVEALQGRLVAVVTNLKPRKLMGIESDGMIVAASDEGKAVLVTFTEPVQVGSRLR